MFNAEREKAYEHFREQNFEKYGFEQDNEKLMLTQNPWTGEQAPRLSLQTMVTNFSRSIFCRTQIATNETERVRKISTLIGEGVCSFPHTLCMQAVVVTRDGWILFTHRKPNLNKAYDPGSWSASLEENFNVREDLPKPDRALQWAKRALRQELMLKDGDSDDDNLRASSVFLEANFLNCALCCILPLELTRQDLDGVIRSPKPKGNYEFDDYCFLSPIESLREFLYPELRPHHSHTDYRIYRVNLHLLGYEETRDRLLWLQSNPKTSIKDLHDCWLKAKKPTKADPSSDQPCDGSPPYRVKARAEQIHTSSAPVGARLEVIISHTGSNYAVHSDGVDFTLERKENFLIDLFAKQIFNGYPSESKSFRDLHAVVDEAEDIHKKASATLRRRIMKLNEKLAARLGAPPQGKTYIMPSKGIGYHLGDWVTWQISSALRGEFNAQAKGEYPVDPQSMAKSTPNRGQKLQARPRDDQGKDRARKQHEEEEE